MHMITRLLFTSLVLVLNLLTVTRLHAETHFVDIVGSSFSPQTLTIQEGDTVVWTERDGAGHSTTSDTGIWNSGSLNFEESYNRIFTSAGNFPYHCEPHPFMTGTIVVESAGTPPPTVNIIAPAHNTSYPGPTNVTIEATASATGATITDVEFLNGTNSLGSVTNAPYRIITPFPAGTHSLTARATDSNGGIATSPSITISVQGAGTRITNAFAQRIAKSDLTIELTKIADGMVSPLGLTFPDDDSGRLFIYDQVGLIHVIENGIKLSSPLLDVRSRLVPFGNYDERGLLGAAAHPLFATHPYIYTYTSETNGAPADFPSVLNVSTTNNHQSVITEWQIDPGNPNQVNMASRREILRIDQPQSNHNGGAMHFGPDGYLYISLGDGGSADDQGNGHSPDGNGQNKDRILGKVIRIDVAGRSSPNGQYRIPPENPFVNEDGVDEIYAWGFRNPYTFSFDSANGELYVADVGQNQVEELNRVFKGGNYGWPIKEGGFFFNPDGASAGFITTAPVRSVPHDLVDPIAQYDHDDGLAIVGGYVYRGTKIPGLTGRYVTGDWGSFATPSGRLYFMDRSEFRELRIGLNNRTLGRWLKGFGQDSEGELYVFGSTTLGPNGTTGEMYKIVPAPGDVVCGVVKTGNQANLSWTSGLGPFVTQTKSDLSDNFWQNAVATNGTLATFSTTGTTQQFFRVSDLAGNPAIPFTAYLTGSAERPTPVTTAGIGNAILSLEGNTLHFNVTYTGLGSTAIAAHIHGPALVSGAAGIQIDLGPYNGGRWGTNGVLFGAVTLTPVQKAMVLDGRTYINVHTVNNSGGEIRGQIAPVAFTSTLNGASERPNPVTTPATGSGILLLAGNQLKINLSYRGLLTTAIAAHIHGPASTSESAGVLVDLGGMHNGAFGTNGSFSGTTTLTAQQLSYLLEGRLYINVHSSGNPGGEIRGQLLARSTAVPFTVPLNGEAERPNPVVTSAVGTGNLFLEGNQLHFELGYNSLSTTAIAAHIHGFADTTTAAGIQKDLGSFNNGAFGTRGAFSGQLTLTDQQRALLAQGKTYVNVHSTQHPGGEIRGQVAPALLQTTLLGASVRPNAVQANANGSARFLLLEKQLHANAGFGVLSSSQATANVFAPAKTDATAASIVALGSYPTSGGIATSVLVNQASLAAIVDGLSYFSVQTTNRPSGEMRGQITP